LVVRLPSNGHYRLGYGMIGYAEIAKDQSGLVGLAHPVMRRMRDALNETVFLSVRIGDHRIDVEQVEGLQELRRVLTLGERKPLYAGSTSKVLLSGMPDWEIEAYLARTDLVAFSAQTIVDKESLWSQIAAIRETGLAEGWDERNSGGAGAAAAIRGPHGETMAAIAIGVPTGRLTPALTKRVIQTVRDGANEISALLCKAAPTKGHKSY
jgi:DNA-binding IclR family transcriptional regulator